MLLGSSSTGRPTGRLRGNGEGRARVAARRPGAWLMTVKMPKRCSRSMGKRWEELAQESLTFEFWGWVLILLRSFCLVVLRGCKVRKSHVSVEKAPTSRGQKRRTKRKRKALEQHPDLGSPNKYCIWQFNEQLPNFF